MNDIDELIEEYSEELDELTTQLEQDQNYEDLVGFDFEISTRIILARRRIEDLEYSLVHLHIIR
jgi:hypothetical protein